MPGVVGIATTSAPYRLASRDLFEGETGVEIVLRDDELPVASTRVGGRAPLAVIVSSRWAMGGENRLHLLAPLLREGGCSVLHVGRLSPSSRGDRGREIGIDALRWARRVAHEHRLAISVEISDANQLGVVGELVDMVAVGSANMQDFRLLGVLGRTELPVLLKRGPSATVEEFLLAAEYILLHGNGRVILCESGIRTFDSFRNPRFEISAIPLIDRSTHLPLIADPSQAVEHAAVVPAVARAAIAAGADGLLLEVGTEAFHDPEGTAIDVDTLHRLLAELRPIARAVGRRVGAAASAHELTISDPIELLHTTDRTLAQAIESTLGVHPELDVLGQWREPPSASSWLAPPLSPDGDLLGRATGYRMGEVRLSRNLSYVDLGRIDPTLAALLESKQLNLGQLFVDERILKLRFEYGSDEDAGELDAAFRTWFKDEIDDLYPYVWRRYHAVIDRVVAFVVVEALPMRVWQRVLGADRPALALEER
jgi:3-deoxy-7-phosphoheptulonate synthase